MQLYISLSGDEENVVHSDRCRSFSRPTGWTAAAFWITNRSPFLPSLSLLLEFQRSCLGESTFPDIH